MKKGFTNIIVTGSLAYDYIMDFPGKFSDHILPEKIHKLNLSFGLNKIERKFGGTAGNIVYSLSLLGLRANLVSCGGYDFNPYLKHLNKLKINLSGLRISKKYQTAAAYIITDKVDNQITGFYAGAMNENNKLKISRKTRSLAIISPDKAGKMVSYGKEFKKMGIDFIFDPGQAITSLSSKQIELLLAKSKIVIANDYEMELMLKKAKISLSSIKKKMIVIITYGPKGSIIYSDNKAIKFKSVKVLNAVDPTGAGDAYRAGLLAGMVWGLEWSKVGAIATAAASFAVEKYGTQEHYFNLISFNKRLYKNFGFKI